MFGSGQINMFSAFLCQYKGLFVKAQSTSLLIDIINALWFVDYS